MSRVGRGLRDILLESSLIIFSILLALAVNGWADGRRQERLADHALERFAREIRDNRGRIEAILPYHRALLHAVTRVDSLGGVHSFAEWRREVPEFSGFYPAELVTTAWESAVTLGVLSGMGYDTVAALSELYGLQDDLDRFNWSYLPLFDFSDGSMPTTVRRANAYFQTVLSYEEALLQRYGAVLATIGYAETEPRPEPRPEARPGPR